MADYDDVAWGRLGQAIRRRRAALRLRQEDLALQAQISPNTVRNLERGAPARWLTLARVDAALGWADGSCQAVLDGGDPKPVREDEPRPTTGSVAERLLRLAADGATRAELRAAAANADDPAEVAVTLAEAFERYRQDLTRAQLDAMRATTQLLRRVTDRSAAPGER